MQYKPSSALDYFPLIILLKEVKCIEEAISCWHLQKDWFASDGMCFPGLSGGDVPAAGAGWSSGTLEWSWASQTTAAGGVSAATNTTAATLGRTGTAFPEEETPAHQTLRIVSLRGMDLIHETLAERMSVGIIIYKPLCKLLIHSWFSSTCVTWISDCFQTPEKYTTF